MLVENPSQSCEVDSYKHLRRDFRAEQTEKALLAQKPVVEETLAEWKSAHPELGDLNMDLDEKSLELEKRSVLSKLYYLKRKKKIL
jgi:hypothetical protein